MNKRQWASETEDDMLKFQREFYEERAKNPNMVPAATCVRMTNLSLFAQKKKQLQENKKSPNACETTTSQAASTSVLHDIVDRKLENPAQQTEQSSDPISENNKEERFCNASAANTEILLKDIQEKILGDVHGTRFKRNTAKIVLGDVKERNIVNPGMTKSDCGSRVNSSGTAVREKSIFARSMASKINKGELQQTERQPTEPQSNNMPIVTRGSFLIEDERVANDIHAENMRLISQMREADILAEREKLLNSIDPALVKFLTEKRRAKAASLAKPKLDDIKGVEGMEYEISKSNVEINPSTTMTKESESTEVAVPLKKKCETNIQGMEIEAKVSQPKKTKVASESSSKTELDELDPTIPAYDLLQRSNEENWLNFDVVEKDKLDWMSDIPAMSSKLKAGERFEARFDWKGVLLPYSLDDDSTKDKAALKDERELYLHGAEPSRPGYTLQELFRLARSNVLQQRVSAFGAIGGILNIYNQGFYDEVLELPITKIFFLLRFGLDDNTPAQLEVVSKALAYLFYNETDETSLDYIFDNADCYWQPTLPVTVVENDADDPTSIENLQKQMELLKINSTPTISANVEENEDESKTSMSDFQLAETDLIECLIRTNIFKRIYFILNNVRPENKTVISCIKLLIRLARTCQKTAETLANESDLMACLMQNFLPLMNQINVTETQARYYNYPQYLCLKLIRILIAQHVNLTLVFKDTPLLNLIQEYIFNCEDKRSKLIRVQIEAMRILRCLLLLRVIDIKTFKQYLPALRRMLDWHYNRCVYEVGGSALIRQHASALLSILPACSAYCTDVEVLTLLGEILHDCCCSWLHKATRCGEIKEYSQSTFLATVLNAIAWYTRHAYDAASRLRNLTTRYLPAFVKSQCFISCVENLSNASIVVRGSYKDRRYIHTPLPNVGSILMNRHGPQLALTQTYSVPLLCNIWLLQKELMEQGDKALFEALLQPEVVEPLVKFLNGLPKRLNRFLATNFFARNELQLIYQLLCFQEFSVFLDKTVLYTITYNFLCCLTKSNAKEIKHLFELYIFNEQFIQVDKATLDLWRQTCLKFVYKHILEAPSEPTLTLPFSQPPILPTDWPYFQLGIMLKNFIESKQQKPAMLFSERDILSMTLNFVTQIESDSMQLQIVSPTEKLMYLMICFMGPDTEFLNPDINGLLRTNLVNFYAQCADTTFDFDATYPDKCKFENLYALFTEQFQAASYGDELFSSLVLVPLAQKYDNKWRRRLWSEYAGVVTYLNCDESLLIGGLAAYLEPAEEDTSLLNSYLRALRNGILRPRSIMYKIAHHHVTQAFGTNKLTKKL